MISPALIIFSRWPSKSSLVSAAVQVGKLYICMLTFASLLSTSLCLDMNDSPDTRIERSPEILNTSGIPGGNLERANAMTSVRFQTTRE